MTRSSWSISRVRPPSVWRMAGPLRARNERKRARTTRLATVTQRQAGPLAVPLRRRIQAAIAATTPNAATAGNTA